MTFVLEIVVSRIARVSWRSEIRVLADETRTEAEATWAFALEAAVDAALNDAAPVEVKAVPRAVLFVSEVDSAVEVLESKTLLEDTAVLTDSAEVATTFVSAIWVVRAEDALEAAVDAVATNAVAEFCVETAVDSAVDAEAMVLTTPPATAELNVDVAVATSAVAVDKTVEAEAKVAAAVDDAVDNEAWVVWLTIRELDCVDSCVERTVEVDTSPDRLDCNASSFAVRVPVRIDKTVEAEVAVDTAVLRAVDAVANVDVADDTAVEVLATVACPSSAPDVACAGTEPRAAIITDVVQEASSSFLELLFIKSYPYLKNDTAAAQPREAHRVVTPATRWTSSRTHIQILEEKTCTNNTCINSIFCKGSGAYGAVSLTATCLRLADFALRKRPLRP